MVLFLFDPWPHRSRETQLWGEEKSMPVKENNEWNPGKQITSVYQNVIVETMKLWPLPLHMLTNAGGHVWPRNVIEQRLLLARGPFSGGSFGNRVFFFSLCITVNDTRSRACESTRQQGKSIFRPKCDLPALQWNQCDRSIWKHKWMVSCFVPAWRRMLQYQSVTTVCTVALTWLKKTLFSDRYGCIFTWW